MSAGGLATGGCMHSWNEKASRRITSACIAFIVKLGWPCDAVVGATAS
ncbi:putative a, transposase OrfB [Burkholderia pseudomallei MSHR7527]|nr:putative a, transposase OrfB [Burkholderia pseudomallei MSHR5492]KGS63192.1 putative a, transposase OrfB [Burkholderia pseudomallei MSHR7527]